MKQTNSNFSKKLFCMMLCLCVVFSQMSFALADVGAGDGSEPGETPSEENVHRTHYHYNAETGECDGTCIEGINLAKYAGDSTGLKTMLSAKNGNKVANPYYYIDDLEGWKAFVEYINSDENVQSSTSPTTVGSFRSCTVWLTQDLDLKDWGEQVPVGSLQQLTVARGKIQSPKYNGFCGTFDGNSHSITGIKITTRNGNATGLFAFSYYGEFKNLTAEGKISINEETSNTNPGGIGGIIGAASNVKFSNLVNRVAIISKNTGTGSAVGGICGSYFVTQVNFSECRNEAALQGKSDVGGIVGYANMNGYLNFTKCANTGKLTTDTSTAYAAGILGKFTANSKQELKISGCYNSGEISATKTAGLCGYLTNVKTLDVKGSFSSAKDVKPYNSSGTNTSNPKNVFYVSNEDKVEEYYTAVTKLATRKNVWFMNQATGENVFMLSGEEGSEKIEFADKDAPIISQITLTGYSASTPIKVEEVKSKEEDKSIEIADATDQKECYIDNATTVEITLKNPGEGGIDATIIRHAQGSEAYNGSRKASTAGQSLTLTVPIAEENGQNLEVKFGTKAESEIVASYEWYEKDKEASEYKIKNLSELLGFTELVNRGNNFAGKTILLEDNINLDEICGENKGNWTPIGTNSSNIFKGIFDGQNHEIKGLYIASETEIQKQGFFGYVNTAEIKNLTVSGEMLNCTGSAGIAADATDSKFVNCVNQVKIDIKVSASETTTETGGVVGVATRTSYILDCKNNANLRGTKIGGGIVGLIADNMGKVTIGNCENNGNIYATSGDAGGITKTYNYTNKENGLYNCRNTGAVTSVDGNAGGIAAQLTGKSSSYKYNGIEKCENTAVVTAENYAGGIVGYVTNTAANTKAYVKNCANTGKVSSEMSDAAGGLIGYLEIKLRTASQKAFFNMENSFSFNQGIQKAIGTEYNMYGTNASKMTTRGSEGITYSSVYYMSDAGTDDLEQGNNAFAALNADTFLKSKLVKKLNENGNNFWGWNPQSNENPEGFLYPVFDGFEKYPVCEIRFIPFTDADAEKYEIGIEGETLSQDSTGSYLDFAGHFTGKASVVSTATETAAEAPVAVLVCSGKATIYENPDNITIPLNITADAQIHYGNKENYKSLVYTEWYDETKDLFTIETAGQLQSVAELVSSGKTFEGKTLKLGNDIDLSAVCSTEKGSWQPIGTTQNKFKGTFDGNGKTISGLYISNAEDKEPQGLFGYTYDATVKNFTISGEVNNNGSGATSGVIGVASGTAADYNHDEGKTEITDIEANVTVSGAGTYTGGIVGYIYSNHSGKFAGTTIIVRNLDNKGDCTYTGSSASSYAGGVAGALAYGDISSKGIFAQSRNSGSVTNAKGIAGGLIGKWASDYMYEMKTTGIEDVYNTGNVTADKAGGVIGETTIESASSDKPSLKRAVNYGSVNGTTQSYGIAGKPSKGNCNAEQVYYLDNTLGSAPSEEELGNAVSTETLAKGEIAFLLDNGESKNRRGVWGQDIANSRPEFYSAISAPLVYKLTTTVTNGSLTLDDTLSSLKIWSNASAGSTTTFYFTAMFDTPQPIIKWQTAGMEEDYVLNTFRIYDQAQTELAAVIDEENNNITVTVPFASNLDATAEFIKVPNLGSTMKLILHGNGGTIGEEEQTEIEAIVGNRFHTITELNTDAGFKNGKYEFTGWYLDADCTKAVDMSSRMVPEDKEPLQIDVYAGWDMSSLYYQVILDANGGTFAEELADEQGNLVLDVKEGNSLDLAAYNGTNVAREGYTFVGWFFDTEQHLPYSGEGITDNTTLYAGWQEEGTAAVPQKMITFDANGGYFNINGQQVKRYYAYVEAGTAVTLETLAIPEIARDMTDGYGYRFAGWFETQAPTAPETSWSGCEHLNENLLLYANWTQKTFVDYIEALKNDQTSDTVVIKDAKTLQAFRDYVEHCKENNIDTTNDRFALGADIVLEDNWTRGIDGFEGIFDGNGHTVTYADAGASIFETVKGTVKNINVAGRGSMSGGIARTLDGGSIEGCTIKSGTVLNSDDIIGGIVGTILNKEFNSGKILECRIESGVTISGGNFVGGIAGQVSGSDGTPVIENCSVGAATIKGAGSRPAEPDGNGDPNPANGSGKGGLGGILGYGAGRLSDCMSDALIEAEGSEVYGIGGIVGVKGSTQGKLEVERCGFTGTIKAEGKADSVGGILGSNSDGGSNRVNLNDVYANGTIDIAEHGDHMGGIMGSMPKNYESYGTTTIKNAYWNGTIANPVGKMFDTIAGNNGTSVSNAYYSDEDGFASSRPGAEGKPGSAFISGELAYELDKSHSPRGTWTQGETGPIFNKDGPAGIIFKVEVDREQTITWPDGTTADITTTVSSDLSEKAGLSDCDKVFVKNGEKVRTTVDKIPSPKVIKNSDGSTTTISYDVTIKDKNGDQILFDSTNPTADVRINKDLIANGTGGSSTETTGGGSGTGGGTGGGDGTGDKPGDGDGDGTGDGQGDGDQSGDGQGGQQGDGTGETGNKGDNPNGGTGTGTDVTPSVTPKPATAVPAKQQTTPQEIKEDPAASQASDDNDHEQIDQPESGGQSQGGGEQGEIQPESKIYKLIKSVTDTVRENPAASAAILIAVIGIIAFGAWNRKRKEDHSTKK